MDEVKAFLKMLDEVYGVFGLDYTMALSTRPEGYLGARTWARHARPSWRVGCIVALRCSLACTPLCACMHQAVLLLSLLCLPCHAMPVVP